MTGSGPSEPLRGWLHVPPTVVAEAPWTSAVAFIVVCLGPVVALSGDGVGGGWSLTIFAAAVLGGVAARRGHREIGPFLVVGAALIALTASGSGDAATWQAVGTLAAVVAAWWSVGREFADDRATRAQRMRPVVAISAVAAGILVGTGADSLALFLAIAGLAFAQVVELPVPVRWLRVLDRPIEQIGRAVGALAGLPALALVTLRWGTDHLVGHDPLRPGRTTGWMDPPAGVGPTRLHAAGPTQGRWRARISALVALAILAAPGLWWALQPDQPPTPAAVTDDPNWPGVFAETSDLTRRLRLDPTTVFRLPDYQGEHVNQQNGRRRTWEPPPCDCPRYEIWWFGASAAWGMYQRDEESIASEIAKAAWARGIALDIQNRATPGFVVDQEVRAIEAALETEEPPDLILVFDGANDATMQVDRNAVGRGDDRSGGPDIDRSLSGLSRIADAWADLRRDDLAGRTLTRSADTVPPLTPNELADHVAARFRANVTSARAVAAARDTPIAFFWQPTVASTPVGTGDPGVNGGDEWARVMRRTPAELDDLVIDLSNALATTNTPVFIDEVHVSEHGAEVLGQAIADQVMELLALPNGQ